MANLYVRSTDGSDADNGTTWALAKATLSGAAAIDAAGDFIYVSQVHAESSAAAQTINLAGTLASPTRVICGNDGAAPPTAVSTAGTVSTTGANNISINGNAYVYGLTFNAGSSTSQANLNICTDGNFQRYQNCVFVLNNTNSSSNILLGQPNFTQDMRVELVDCQFKYGNTSQVTYIFGKVQITGGSIVSGSSTPSYIFNLNTSGERCYLVVESFDFSNFSSSVSLTNTAASPAKAVFRNCKLPASWSGSLSNATPSNSMARVELHNCDSADTNYRMIIQDYTGTIITETTIVRSGGASDGTTSISWKLVSTANAEYPLLMLDTPEIVRWNDTIGSSITVTVEVITDNVTLTDDECWIEVQYLGTSGVPLGTVVRDCKANVLATAANQTTSSATWTTTGLTTPTKQRLAVSFTPQEKGFIHAVVKLAKASATVYVDPKLTVT